MSRVVPTWWAEVCDGYFRWLRRKGARPNTIRTYRTELWDFGQLLLERKARSLEEVQRSHIEDWQDNLVERKAGYTQRVAASSLRGLLKWAAAEEMPLSNPTLFLRVTLPRVPNGQPRPIPDLDLAVLKRALAEPAPADPWRLRTRALFWLLYSSSLRISEALSLMRDAFEDGDSAAVFQKGHRAHTAVISQTAGAAIADYLAVRTDRLPNMFISLHADVALGRKEVQASWDLLTEALQIRRIKSHALRHTCLTEIVRETGDVLLAAAHAGHSDLNTIRRYAAVGMSLRRQAVALIDGGRSGSLSG